MSQPPLRASLQRPDDLIRRWPIAGNDAMMMISVLRAARPSLAEALNLGLFDVVNEGRSSSARLALGFQRAIIRAMARDDDGRPVHEPCDAPKSVTWLELTSLTERDTEGEVAS